MSDNIPFEIQMEIIKRLPVKPLIQFRSVSKLWKSVIDSSDFINGYGARHTQPHSHILRYKAASLLGEEKYICLVDDDIENFKVQEQEFVVSTLLKQFSVFEVVGASHGLLCLFGASEGYKKWMFVIWNPSIGKSFGIGIPNYKPRIQIKDVFGFGVCPVTRDPTVVKLVCAKNMPWHVEVFTLSLGVWNVIPNSNLPRQSVRINSSNQVVIDRFIHWGASEMIRYYDGEVIFENMVVSFDLITKEFKVVDLPHNLTNELTNSSVYVSKLRGSLVVYGSIIADEALCCGVWIMENDSSFTKLFTIGAHVDKILGFNKSGETIFVIQDESVRLTTTTLNVYDPYSQRIKNLGISRKVGSFFMGSYKESLLLLGHSDLHIYSDDDS